MLRVGCLLYATRTRLSHALCLLVARGFHLLLAYFIAVAAYFLPLLLVIAIVPSHHRLALLSYCVGLGVASFAAIWTVSRAAPLSLVRFATLSVAVAVVIVPFAFRLSDGATTAAWVTAIPWYQLFSIVGATAAIMLTSPGVTLVQPGHAARRTPLLRGHRRNLLLAGGKTLQGGVRLR